MLSDDIRLRLGDRRVVLATIQGLKHIEQGVMAPRLWQVSIEEARSPQSIQEGAGMITAISGCGLSVAQTLLDNLPGLVAVPLYKHQAFPLVRKLKRVHVKSRASQVPL